LEHVMTTNKSRVQYLINRFLYLSDHEDGFIFSPRWLLEETVVELQHLQNENETLRVKLKEATGSSAMQEAAAQAKKNYAWSKKHLSLLPETDPCPGCYKGAVCRTPSCGRLKLPIDHPYRTQETQQTGLDPEMGFILDGANEGELAAYDYAVHSHCAAVLDILDGKDAGAGSNNEPWATVRKRLLDLVNNSNKVVYELSPTDIFEFAGWLTTRPGIMKVGPMCDASYMADAVGEYLKIYPERFSPRKG
jgi:hypothetical protein